MVTYSFKVDKQYTKGEEVPMTYYKFTKYVSRPLALVLGLFLLSPFNKYTMSKVDYIYNVLLLIVDIVFLIGAYGKKKVYAYYGEIGWLVISCIFALYELCFNREIIVFIETIFACYLVYVYYKKRELLFK